MIQKYNGHFYDINEAIIRLWRVYILIISVHTYMWWSCLRSYCLSRLETIYGFDSRDRIDVTRRHIWRHLTSEFSAVSRYFRNGSSQKRKPMKIGEERTPKRGEGHSPGTRTFLTRDTPTRTWKEHLLKSTSTWPLQGTGVIWHCQPSKTISCTPTLSGALVVH
jgi:hypothetical protein